MDSRKDLVPLETDIILQSQTAIDPTCNNILNDELLQEANVESDGDDDEEEEKIKSLILDLQTQDFQQVMKVVLEKERRLKMESNQNSILLPDIQKRTQCIFSVDQQAHQFLCNSSLTLTLTFRDYISTKRETKGIEATLNQCGQFFTFVVVGDRFSEAYCEVVGHRFRSKSSIRILIELTNSFAIQSMTKSFTLLD